MPKKSCDIPGPPPVANAAVAVAASVSSSVVLAFFAASSSSASAFVLFLPFPLLFAAGVEAASGAADLEDEAG
jgi:hypothetical protein